MSSYARWLLCVLVAGIAAAGCGKQTPRTTQTPLGSEGNPIKMALVPSLDANKLVASGETLAALLEKQTGLKFKVSVPPSYTAVVTAMGAGTVDVGFLSPLPYVLAHDLYGVNVILVTVRDNSTKYWSFVIARNDTGINKLSDLKGKKFAYGDPLSTSGCLYAKDLIRKSGWEPGTFFSEAIYAGAHDKVVIAVYNKQVDAGAIYGGVVSDAREKVAPTIRDVTARTKVIARSAEIPNDTVSVRKGLSAEIVKKVKDGLIAVAKSDEGRMTVMEMYGIDGFVPASNSDYDSVRGVARAEHIKLGQLDK